jgi:serine/threonine protein kinase
MDPKVEERLKKQCPELNQLPKNWKFKVNTDSRISFINISTRETSYNHPTLGGLPRPWILTLVRDEQEQLVPRYYDRQTRKQTKEDPRYMASTLERHSSYVPKDLRIAATTTKNNAKIDINHLKRTPIDYQKNNRNQYTQIHTIDPGDGSVGAMNGGVFVVTMKGLPSRIFIEKRFKPKDVSFGKQEIEMMHRVRHPALANFVAAFILEHSNPPEASLYIEFCDRGSLDNLIRAFANRRKDVDRNVTIPEGFVWHVFTGLADGLAYLRDGVSYWRKKKVTPNPNWVPILHRDIKPDNVLLRSRSTLGSNKYFYCVLSDFGLACEDRPNNDPLADDFQQSGNKLGTKPFWAPELCYDPYPNGNYEIKFFPKGQRHSQYSDVWALGACVYNLCDLTATHGINHCDFDRMRRIPGMDIQIYMEGTECRKDPLKIPSNYTRELREAIVYATRWNPVQRPSPVRLIERLGPLVDASGYGEQGPSHEPLPEWATKVHDYLSKAEQESKSAR